MKDQRKEAEIRLANIKAAEERAKLASLVALAELKAKLKGKQ